MKQASPKTVMYHHERIIKVNAQISLRFQAKLYNFQECVMHSLIVQHSDVVQLERCAPLFNVQCDRPNLI